MRGYIIMVKNRIESDVSLDASGEVSCSLGSTPNLKNEVRHIRLDIRLDCSQWHAAFHIVLATDKVLAKFGMAKLLQAPYRPNITFSDFVSFIKVNENTDFEMLTKWLLKCAQIKTKFSKRNIQKKVIFINSKK